MIRRILSALGQVVIILSIVLIFVTVFSLTYFVGFRHGQNIQFNEDQTFINGLLENFNKEQTSTIVYVEKTPQPQIQQQPITWGGPDLWQAVNSARVQNGVGMLNQADELCTIASIRLNEILELDKLDGHEGFSTMSEKRPDLKWIFEKYGQVAEFLVSGATSPQNAVDLWFNTLGHKKLITGGEYVYGCIYAQAGFGVAITAF